MTTKLTLGAADVIWTCAADGHLGHMPPRGPHDETCCGADANARRIAVHAGKWTHLTQVHGASVVVADESTRPGVEADAALCNTPGVTLVIATADCAPIALSSVEGVVGAVHAGWVGLQKGVIERAVSQMRELGASEIEAALGPCIHAECYEFTEEALTGLVTKWGTLVRGETSEGKPAFDLPAAVIEELSRFGVPVAYEDARCTGCSGEFFSFRTTATMSRQVMLVGLQKGL